jgi:hypothetical protein
LINVVFQYYAALFGLPNDSSMKYTRNPGEKYWNNFSTAQWCIVMDDIAAQAPSLGVEDPSLKEIIGVMNNVAYQPDQASLEDKGRTPVQAKLVIATTNTAHLNAFAYFSCPIAVQRRLPFVVDVKVKPEFAHNRMLDHTVLRREDGRFPDYWILSLFRVIPEDDTENCKKGKLQLVREFSDITVFLAWLGDEALTHERVQTHISDEMRDTARIQVCPDCRSVSYRCGCGYASSPDSSEVPMSGSESDHHEVVYDLGEDPATFYDARRYTDAHFGFSSAGSSSGESDGNPASDSDDGGPLDYAGVERATTDESSFEEQADFMRLEAPASTPWFSWPTFARPTLEWLAEDWDSLVYTILYLWWGVMWGILTPFLGALMWFRLDIFERYVLGTWLEARFMGFVFRRLGRQMNRRYLPLIRWAKTFTFLTLGVGVGYKVGSALLSRAVPNDVLICKCCREEAKTLFIPVVEELPAQEVLKVRKAAERSELPTAPAVPILEQALVDEGVAPVPHADERPAVWYKKEFALVRRDVQEVSCSWKSLERDQVRAKIRNAALRVDITGEGFKARRTGAVALGGHLYAINTHALPDANVMCFSITSVSEGGVTTNHSTVVVRTQFWKSKRSDITYFSIRGLPPARDLTRLFPQETFTGRFDANYVGLTNEHTPYNRTLHKVECETMERDGKDHAYFGGVVTEVTNNGDCGAILIVWSGFGPVVAGIHALGSLDSLAKAARFFPEDAQLAREYLGATNFQCGEPVLNAPSAPLRAIVALDEKSPFRYIEKGTASVFGSLSGPRHAPRSRVKDTPMAPLLLPHGYQKKFGPPVMKGWRPWRHAAVPMVANKDSLFREDILKEASACFLSDILAGLSQADLDSIHPYDRFTAVNGATGLSYVDSIKKKTSAGFPYCTTKEKFLVPLEPRDGFPAPVDLCPEVLESMREIEGRYAKGIRHHPVFKATLKDESTKFKKIETGKTRVFGGAPLDWSVLGRQLFLPIIRVIQNNRYLFESAPGTVAQSKEWGHLHDYLTEYGVDLNLAGDFADFDKGMLAMLILEAFWILRKIAEKAGYTEEALRAMEGFGLDTAFPMFDFNGDLVEFMGSNPSGHILTVIINGLVNCLYMRYCYVVLNPKHEAKSFKANVNLMTYGDDNVACVSPNAPWYNHTAVQRVLADHGVKYTMPDKEAESRPYMSIHEVTFLKRAWRYDPDVGEYLCPLEHESIEKSLMTWVESVSVSAGEQAVDVMSSATFEYFFYGKEIFEEKRKLMLGVIEELGFSMHATPGKFPVWEELAARYDTSC